METINKTLQNDLHVVETSWKEQFHFVSRVNDHEIHLDKLHVHNGTDQGPRPKPLILSAVGGCLGMEMVATAEKMRVKIENLAIAVTGELSDNHPKIYQKINVVISIKTEPENEDKIQRAADLAWNRYCGVVAMIRHFAAAEYKVEFL
jgi:putative redox protein